MEKSFTVKVNDSHTFEIEESAIEKLDLLKLSPSTFHVLSQNKSFDIGLEKSDFLNKKYIISVNTNTYEVQIENDLDKLIKAMGFSIGSAKKMNEINAPMPGIILSVSVEEGQAVKEGDTLLILEAMKMENAIGAPRDGIVKTVKVKRGGTVEKGALMIAFE
jgi:biotin carboxyl carrier protein